MNCSGKCTKQILFILNVAFVLGGILLIVAGSLTLKNLDDVKSNEAIRIAAFAAIILGMLVLVVSVMGCFGAIKENVCIISTYSYIMLVLLGLEAVLMVWLFLRRDFLLDKMEKQLDEQFEQYDHAKEGAMDIIQLNYVCCGLKGFNDYINKGLIVPASCCGKLRRSDHCPPDEYKDIIGCKEKFGKFWSTNFLAICLGCIIVMLFELILMTIACCLLAELRPRK